ncbi:MAG: hypothetical protein ACI8XM_001724 [Haloarculaceae archaeon]|jgi:hypothetical protein
MTDPDPADPGDVDDLPTVTCQRCGQTWDLAYELEDLQVGNRALERFALDHKRHTGHFPDDVTPWLADCRNCPDEDAFLSETPARRWASVHVRHTRHAVDLYPPETDDPERVTHASDDAE